MNTVIYTRDMEPITVIDLPLWALEAGERQAVVRVAVIDPVPEKPLLPSDPVPQVYDRVVSLEFIPIRLGARRSYLIMTHDEELALLLRPSWLPGQRAKINDYERWTKELSHMLLQTLARGMGGH